jgi:hypothetical protein
VNVVVLFVSCLFFTGNLTSQYSWNVVNDCNHLEIFVRILHRKQERLDMKKNRPQDLSLDIIPKDRKRTRMSGMKHYSAVPHVRVTESSGRLA